MSKSDLTTSQPLEQAKQAKQATEAPATPSVANAAEQPKEDEKVGKPTGARRRWWVWAIGAAIVIFALIKILPRVISLFSTVSTDDAYVNGHVTFVASRVAGQVVRVLVDDNNRVRKGDLLVQLDKEPYQVKVNIARAAEETAQTNLKAAQAQIRGLEGQARSFRFSLDHAIEDVDNQVALLRSKVAILKSKEAALKLAQADYDRFAPLLKSEVISKQEFDVRTEALSVAKAQAEEALQGVNQVRTALGLPPGSAGDKDLAQVPADIDQTFSAVRQAQFSLIQVVAQLGIAISFNVSPKQMYEDFYKRDPEGNIDRILVKLAKDAPAIKQAEAKLAEAQRGLDEAQLNLRYCDVFAEIAGVVTRREVNSGNNVIAGEALMAVRSLTDIWIDANFKETQLAKLRIGQPVDLDVDMYGSRIHFKGRISGFTMGTGSTLALLPAENATGNFVKVVQRLSVRIDLLDYNPEKTPLFIGLSVTPHVLIKEAPTGPDAGKVLQPPLKDLMAKNGP